MNQVVLEDEYLRCKKLWFAVMFQGISDLTWKERDKGHQRFVQSQARRWIKGESTNVGSFLWVCDTLGVSAFQLRMACADRDLMYKAKERLYEYNRNLIRYKKAEKKRIRDEQD